MSTQVTLRNLAASLREWSDLATVTAANLDRLIPLVPAVETITGIVTTPPPGEKPAEKPTWKPAVRRRTTAVVAPEVSEEPRKARPSKSSVARASSFQSCLAKAIDLAPAEFTAPDLIPLLTKAGHPDEATRCTANPSRVPVALLRFVDTGRVVRTGAKRGSAPIYSHGARHAVTLTPAQQLHESIRREVDAKIYRPDQD